MRPASPGSSYPQVARADRRRVYAFTRPGDSAGQEFALRLGGAGIHMSDIPTFPYRLLWGERSVASVANLTRADGAAFMRLAGEVDLKPVVEAFALADAPEALSRLKHGRVRGAAVLVDTEGAQ